MTIIQFINYQVNKKQPDTMNKEKIRQVYNIIMISCVAFAWLKMFFNTEDGILTSRGFVNLKYYTTLSNIFAAAVAVIWLIYKIKKKDMRRLCVWKLMSSAAVGVTFMVVIGFLGPLYGYGNMYTGSNFFLHLLVPLMAMTEYIIFNESKLGLKDNLTVMFPPLIYGSVYLVNTIINGVKENDIYGFLIWGYPIGILIFAVICIVAFIIGLALRLINSVILNKNGGSSK